MSEIVMEEVESSLISHRGHSREDHLLNIRFRTKTGVAGSLYEYGNVTPQLYAEGCEYRNDKGELSFGQWMNRVIKADPKRFPFRKLEEIGSIPVAETTTDFASGQPLPATIAEAEVLPEDEEELKAAAEALNQRALAVGEVRGNAIVITNLDAYNLAVTVGTAIARMRDALEKTMRPKITSLYKPYKAALEILNKYDNPLESDEKRLKEGIRLFKLEEDRKRVAESNRIRREQEQEAERVANETAQTLKLSDAVAAEERGEPELAEQILAAPALPIRAAYVPPVNLPSAIIRVAGETHKEDWTYELVDENGDPVQTPRRDLIPDEFWVLDEKAIAKVVKTLKGRTSIRGVRAYDQGAVSFSKKG